MKPPAHSRVSVVVDALRVMCETVADVSVIVGPRGSRTVKKDTVTVADGRSGVSIDRVRAPGLAIAYIETMRIACTIVSRSGGGSVKPRMDRNAVILDAIEDALLADPKMGGTCDLVTLGRTETWDQEIVDNVSTQATTRFIVETRTST